MLGEIIFAVIVIGVTIAMWFCIGYYNLKERGIIGEENLMNNKKDLLETKKQLKKGDEISHFYFIRKTKTGCPRIEHRYIGIKGITLIEVTNVGKSYFSEGHLKKVRVTGIKEDGKTEYQKYFYDVYTNNKSKELRIKYIDAMNKHMAKLASEENRLRHVYSMHDQIITKSLKTLGIEEIEEY